MQQLGVVSGGDDPTLLGGAYARYKSPDEGTVAYTATRYTDLAYMGKWIRDVVTMFETTFFQYTFDIAFKSE